MYKSIPFEIFSSRCGVLWGNSVKISKKPIDFSLRSKQHGFPKLHFFRILAHCDWCKVNNDKCYTDMFFKKNPNHSRKKTSAKIWLFYYFEQFILISKDRPSVTFQAKNDTNINYLLKGHKELFTKLFT